MYGRINLNTIREFVGHTDEKTTLNCYCFDRSDDDERLDRVEKALYEGKRADYLWRDSLWELKNTGSAKSVDSVLRKALKQIRENPGGEIIDFGKSKNVPPLPNGVF